MLEGRIKKERNRKDKKNEYKLSFFTNATEKDKKNEYKLSFYERARKQKRTPTFYICSIFLISPDTVVVITHDGKKNLI